MFCAQLAIVVFTGSQSSATPEVERLRMKLEYYRRKLESKKRVFARFSWSAAEEYDALEKKHNLVLTALKELAGTFLSKCLNF